MKNEQKLSADRKNETTVKIYYRKKNIFFIQSTELTVYVRVFPTLVEIICCFSFFLECILEFVYND